MKLFHWVMWRVSVLLVLVLSFWAVFFYWAMIEEVNDETDDSLTDYAETIIIRALSDEELPSSSNGSNNQYYLYDVSEEYAQQHPHISYHDEMVYIEEKKEEEPARVLMVIFKTDSGSYKELVVYTPTIEKYDLRQAMLEWIVFLYIILLLSILAVNAGVFQRNMKPLYVLLEWLEQYRLGEKTAPLKNKTQITEFRKLNEATMIAVERSEKQFEQQRLFIGNASHEMQTPLAICQNRLEALMDEGSFTEQQLTELAKTHQTLENLTRMNKSLLLLCKIENHQFSDVKNICLNDLLDTYLPDYEEAYSYRRLQVKVKSEGCFSLFISESLASVLLTNLVKNAFVHTPEGGEIEVHSTRESFIVSNDGKEPLDPNRIFERFYQGKKKEGFTGLGLALVDSICKVNHLIISYSYINRRHQFTVSHAPS